MKNKKLIIILVSLIAVIPLAFATSYALFRLNVNDNNGFKVAIGNLELKIEDTKTEDKVVIDNLIPTSESDALKEDGYKFTLKNTGTLDSSYTIYLDDININTDKEKLDSSLIYVNLYDETKKEGTTYRLSELTDRILQTGDLKRKESNEYVLRIWLDINAGNDAQDKYFASQIRVEGTQYIEDDNTK